MNKILITILIQATCILFIQGCTLQGQPGTCKLVKDCLVLLERLKPENRDSDPSIKNFTLEAVSACSQQQNSGSENSPLLCCTSSTTSTSTSSTISTSTSSRPSVSSVSSVSSSPSSGGCGTFAAGQDIKSEGPGEASIGAWPWIALIGSNGPNGKEFFCEGTLISDRHVLSAAHCAYGNRRINFVRVGDYDLSTETDCAGSQCVPLGKMQEISVDSIRINPRYNIYSRKCNDIAVIKLRSSVVEDGRYVQHICLPNSLRNDLNINLDSLQGNLHGGFIAGWGRNKDRNINGSNVLMQANLRFGSDDRCAKLIGALSICQEKEHILCAADCAGGPCTETCIGDAGGPIMMSYQLKWYVIGVASIGPSTCGSVGSVGLYTNVNHFIGWIRQNML